MERSIPIETGDLVDSLVDATLKAHSDIETPLDKYCNVLNIFSWMPPSEVAKLLQIDEEQDADITVGNVPKDSDLENRLNQTCTYALTVYDKCQGNPIAIRATVERLNPMLRKNSISPARSPLQCIQQGETYRVLLTIAVEGEF